jgi:putative transposase
VKYAFIGTQLRYHTLSILCQMLRVSRSGYYGWVNRPVSVKAQADDKLVAQIQRVHHEHRGHSGALKTWRVLQSQGIDGGKHRIARLRQQHDIVAKRRRRFITTTQSKYHKWQAPNLLQRQFTVHQPNRVWVGDVTHIPTREGWLFLAVQIDLFSRQVVGWSMLKHNNSELLLVALNMAIENRGIHPGLIHHSDQGRTYAAKSYRHRLAQAKIISSMSRRGNCWDNAVAESFFATLEFELIEQQVFRTREVAKTAIFEFIEVFYNRQRSHQTLDYKTPLQVEQEYRLVA